jgi:alpha-tubulin suppressor-like RCC1 family protein
VAEEGRAVFACGHGEHGQLGRATPIGCRRMCQGLRQLLQFAWRWWPSEHHHSSASTLEEESLTLGGGSLGQLGLVDREYRTMPSKLGREAFGGSAVTMVSCGVRHTMVVREVGKLFITFRQESWDTATRMTQTCLWRWERPRFRGARIIYAAAGRFHSGVVMPEGRAWTWGTGRFG